MCLGNRLEDFPEKAYSSRQLPFKFAIKSRKWQTEKAMLIVE